MEYRFTASAWEEYWQSRDKHTLRRINELLRDIGRNGYTGIKPEPLKGNFSGFWSRRIDEKNRPVYRIAEMFVTCTLLRALFLTIRPIAEGKKARQFPPYPECVAGRQVGRRVRA